MWLSVSDTCHRALRCVLRAGLGAVAFAVLCACTTVSGGSSGAVSSARPFVFTGLAGEPDSLNVLVSSSADLYELSHLYMSYLVETNDRGQLIPEIATGVPTVEDGGISADGRTITYHLRHGVHWQDGPLLTSGDVVFSYRAQMNPANNVSTRIGYSEVDVIRAPDDYTVVVHLRRPFSPFVTYFGGPQGYPILPAHLLAKYSDLNHLPYNTRPVGSGPYTVVEWRRGDAVTFAANPTYWRGAPHIARMTYRIIPDPNTRLQQLQTGEADAYFDVDPQLLPQLRALSGVRLSLTPVNDLHVLEYNVADGIVGDVRVRQAIARAIDRRRLIEAATHGSGLASEGDQPRNGWAYDANLPAIPYDPAAARRILDAAGWHVGPDGIRAKNGRRLDLGFAISPQGINGSTLVATVVQRNLHDIGVDVTIKQYAPGLMWAPKAAGGILASGEYQLAYYAWWVLGPDPDDSFQFACDQLPPAGLNDYFWCNRRADAAMHAALLTTDRAERTRDYAVVQTELIKDLPELTLWQVQMPNAYRQRLHGLAPSPFGSVFWNAWQWTLDGD